MRVKIILPNLIAVLLVGLIAFFYLRHNLHEKTVNNLRGRLESSRVLLDYAGAIDGFEMLQDVNSRAKSTSVRSAYAPFDTTPIEGEDEAAVDTRIRAEWFQRCVSAVNSYSNDWIDRKGKRPEFILLTDRNGVVLARNISPNACPAGKNVSEAIKTVRRALDGEASYSIWSVADSVFGAGKVDAKHCQIINTGLLEIAAAPVWYEDDIKGSLLIGFEISNGTARKRARTLGKGFDVAVLQDGNVYSSSFGTDTARQSLEEQLNTEATASKIQTARDERKPSSVFEIQIEGRPYMAILSPALNATDGAAITNLILASIDDATSHLSVLMVILAAMALALLVVIIAGFVLTNHFMGPIVAIEEGLLKVINGEYDYRMDIHSSEVGGLGYRINQLIGVLTGEEESDDDDS